MIGKTPESYCVGHVTEPGDAIGKATHRFTNGSIWHLSKLVFDAQAAPAYLGIDLANSKLDPCGRTDPAMKGRMAANIFSVDF